MDEDGNGKNRTAFYSQNQNTCLIMNKKILLFLVQIIQPS